MHEIDIHTDPVALLSTDGLARDTARAALRTALRARLAPLLRTRRPGFVILFGYLNDPGGGNRLAEETTKQIKRVFPHQFRSAVLRPFHYITADLAQQGVVELDIYLLTR